MPQSFEKSELIADLREQILFLRELGVDALSADLLGDRSGKPTVAESPVRLAPKPATPQIQPKIEPKKPDEPRPAGHSRLSSLPTLSDRPLASARLGRPDETPETHETRETPETRVTYEPLRNDETMKQPNGELKTSENEAAILRIRAEIGPNCTRCKLSTLGRKQVVNSVGNFNARLMFVGEAPGADEDAQGEPFVGRAGQLLTDIIEKGLEIPRKDVFIGNINRCRPPGNRAPEPDETVACKPFLLREIAVIKPKVIVVLGATAAHNLLDTKVPIGKLRGHFHDYQGCKIMPTFHPAYLLRDPHKKREVWEDMKLVRDYLIQAS